MFLVYDNDVTENILLVDKLLAVYKSLQQALFNILDIEYYT